MAIGRISGPLLKDNLTRNGVNLAVETDLLYLLVSNSDRTTHNVGIKTTNPAYPLDVNGAAGIAGNLNFTGTGTAVIGDFDNATFLNRTVFKTKTTNASTGIYAVPNGSSTAASWQAINNVDPTNASKILIATNGSTDVQLVSGINGTGTYLPLSFYTSGAQKMQLDTSGNLDVSSSTNAQLRGQVRNTSALSSAYSAWMLGNDTNATAASIILNSSTNTSYGGASSFNIYNGLNSPMAFFISGAEKIRIDNSGNLGVGTTSPSFLLDVAGTNRSYGFTSTVIGTPTAPGGTSAPTGGSLPALTTYYFKIVAVDGLGGVTLPSPEYAGATTTSGSATCTVNLTWTAVAGAKTYQVWYSTATGTQANYFTSTTNSFSFTTTTGNTAGTIPTANTTGFVGIGTSSPTSTLDVIGSIRSRGSVSPTFTLNDGTIENYLRISSSTLQLAVPSANPISFLTTNTEQVRITATGNVIMYGTGALQIPAGTAGQQPTPTAGMLRYNTTINQPEAYTGASWIPMTPPIWGRIFTMIGV